jgi:DNA processing protein
MDLQALVALSLLGGALRSRVAASLREAVEGGAGEGGVDLVGRALASVGLGPEVVEEARGEARDVLATARRVGLGVLAFGGPGYPPLLASIHDPPPVLWVRGDPGALLGPAVAVVGARAASHAALAVAAELGFGLARAGVAVVSGLARGVDAAAHRGALDAGGRTVAVLGCGADRVYPPEHRELAGAVAASGAVVSECPPGAPPRREHFPRRNRVISGLALATVVVEASEKSGSLITARCALDQGREVMAVPGSPLGGRNRGAHALLKDGAKLVERVDDILEELRLGDGVRVAAGGQVAAPVRCEDALVAALADGEACDVDTLAARTGFDAPALLARLLDLELRGVVTRVGGGRFLRVGGRVVM